MKTAISVPDATYQRATQRAKDLGMSRSEFFSRAADRYLEVLDRESVINQIDEAVGSLTQLDGSTADAVAQGHRFLAGAEETW